MKKIRKLLVMMLAAAMMMCMVPGSALETQAASAQTVTVNVKKNVKLKLKVNGKTIKNTKVKWTSKNKKIAKVSKKGVVTGVKVGTTKVIGKYKDKSYTYLIKVENDSKNIRPTQVIGSYVGTHHGSTGGKKIKRNSTVDIQKCSKDGKISGRFIIYPIEGASDQINCIYSFNGKIDLKTGKFTFKGDKWIQYPDVSGNYSFQTYKGTLDAKKCTISGKTEDGAFSHKKGRIDDDGDVIEPGNAFSTAKVIGTYVGTHYGSVNGVNVKRNSTVQILTCTKDGNITGRFIIYPIEGAAKQINCIYSFTGTIDMKTGAIAFQGDKWIEYPDVSGNYTFQRYEGALDVNRGTLSGKTENGEFSYNRGKVDKDGNVVE